MVKTLWFFVPGNSPWNKVTTWKADGNLRFQDLALYKLVSQVGRQPSELAFTLHAC